MAKAKQDQQQDLKRIIESANRLGVGIDEEEALQWLTSMAATKDADDITLNTRTGVFGNSITMLDFSDKELNTLNGLAGSWNFRISRVKWRPRWRYRVPPPSRRSRPTPEIVIILNALISSRLNAKRHAPSLHASCGKKRSILCRDQISS